MLTATRPQLSRDWRKRRALSVPRWLYIELKAKVGPDPQTRAKPPWIAGAEIVTLAAEAKEFSERWLSVVTPTSLPITFAAVQELGAFRLSDRVAIAWLLKTGLRLSESVRELLPLVGGGMPLASFEVVEDATVVLWSRARALPEDRRGELRDIFRSWEGFPGVVSQAWAEWQAFNHPNGRRQPTEAPIVGLNARVIGGGE